MSITNSDFKKHIEKGASIAELLALLENISRANASSSVSDHLVYPDFISERLVMMIDLLAVANPIDPAAKDALLEAVCKAVMNGAGISVYSSEKTDDVLLRIKMQDHHKLVETILDIVTECRLPQGGCLLDGIDIHLLEAHASAKDFIHKIMRQTNG